MQGPPRTTPTTSCSTRWAVWWAWISGSASSPENSYAYSPFGGATSNNGGGVEPLPLCGLLLRRRHQLVPRGRPLHGSQQRRRSLAATRSDQQPQQSQQLESPRLCRRRLGQLHRSNRAPRMCACRSTGCTIRNRSWVAPFVRAVGGLAAVGGALSIVAAGIAFSLGALLAGTAVVAAVIVGSALVSTGRVELPC